MAKCKKGYKKSGNKCVRKGIFGGTKKKNRKIWVGVLIFFGIATLADLMIPDPLPFVDEIVLIAITLFSGYKTIKQKW